MSGILHQGRSRATALQRYDRGPGVRDVDPRVLYERATGEDVSSYRVNPSGWVEVRCPSTFHEDRNGSCSMHSHSGYWICHGCDVRGWPLDLVVAAGRAEDPTEAMEWLDASGVRGVTFERRHVLGSLPPSIKRHRPLSRELQDERLVARYTYRDENGAPVRQTLRYEGWSVGDDGEATWSKRVSQGGWDPESRWWVGTTEGLPEIPYNLPEVIAAARRGETIFIVEGEKCAEALRALGLCATTLPGGANHDFDEDMARWFRGAAAIVVITDSDEPGRAAAARWSRFFSEREFRTEVIDLDPLGDDGYDVDDWLKERFWLSRDRKVECLREEFAALAFDRELELVGPAERHREDAGERGLEP